MKGKPNAEAYRPSMTKAQWATFNRLYEAARHLSEEMIAEGEEFGHFMLAASEGKDELLGIPMDNDKSAWLTQAETLIASQPSVAVCLVMESFMFEGNGEGPEFERIKAELDAGRMAVRDVPDPYKREAVVVTILNRAEQGVAIWTIDRASKKLGSGEMIFQNRAEPSMTGRFIRQRRDSGPVGGKA